ncbi:MAG: ABC transporter ATP-binding protein [Elusimicrobiota bacterium]
MQIIEAKKLKKIFGKISAVDDVTFSVDQGEIFGFLGPNGAGKTTTIRLITGFLTPDSGKALIGGIDIGENPLEAKKKIGVIPEMGNVYEDLSARQNILLTGKFYGIPAPDLKKKTENLLRKFEIYDRKDDKVQKLSKGLKQRVNIASALVHDPEVLFLDEPTSGLDVRSQRLIRSIIKDMKERGTTVFLTTHHIEEANRLCERVAIINKGRIVALDTPEQLKKTFEAVQSVKVSFNQMVDKETIRAGNLVNKIEKSGDKFRIFTNNPDGVVKYLIHLAENKNLEILSLDILNPTLEDAFVEFTGGDNA